MGLGAKPWYEGFGLEHVIQVHMLSSLFVFLYLMKGCWPCLWNHTYSSIVQSDCLGCFLTKKFVEYARSSCFNLTTVESSAFFEVPRCQMFFRCFPFLADECNNLERSLQKKLVFKKTHTKKHIHTRMLLLLSNLKQSQVAPLVRWKPQVIRIFIWSPRAPKAYCTPPRGFFGGLNGHRNLLTPGTRCRMHSLSLSGEGKDKRIALLKDCHVHHFLKKVAKVRNLCSIIESNSCFVAFYETSCEPVVGAFSSVRSIRCFWWVVPWKTSRVITFVATVWVRHP